MTTVEADLIAAPTPGPWSLAARRKGGIKTVVCADKGGRYMHLVAEASSEEDARLIAAAPKLLDAANDAFDFLGGVDGAVEIRAKLLAAISSARSQ